MIKGVGRYAVEIENVDSEFFDRVICFVRPQYVSGGKFDLHREAAQVAENLSADVEEAQRGTRHVLRVTPRRNQPQNTRKSDAYVTAESNSRQKSHEWLLPMLLSAGGGAAAALVISAFL